MKFCECEVCEWGQQQMHCCDLASRLQVVESLAGHLSRIRNSLPNVNVARESRNV